MAQGFHGHRREHQINALNARRKRPKLATRQEQIFLSYIQDWTYIDSLPYAPGTARNIRERVKDKIEWRTDYSSGRPRKQIRRI
jgi:hypothetical protein